MCVCGHLRLHACVCAWRDLWRRHVELSWLSSWSPWPSLPPSVIWDSRGGLERWSLDVQSFWSQRTVLLGPSSSSSNPVLFINSLRQGKIKWRTLWVQVRIRCTTEVHGGGGHFRNNIISERCKLRTRGQVEGGRKKYRRLESHNKTICLLVQHRGKREKGKHAYKVLQVWSTGHCGYTLKAQLVPPQPQNATSSCSML